MSPNVKIALKINELIVSERSESPMGKEASGGSKFSCLPKVGKNTIYESERAKANDM